MSQAPSSVTHPTHATTGPATMQQPMQSMPFSMQPAHSQPTLAVMQPAPALLMPTSNYMPPTTYGMANGMMATGMATVTCPASNAVDATNAVTNAVDATNAASNAVGAAADTNVVDATTTTNEDQANVSTHED